MDLEAEVDVVNVITFFEFQHTAIRVYRGRRLHDVGDSAIRRRGQGATVPKTCRALEVSERTFYKWRKDAGRLKLSQARRLRQLEKENGRLKRPIADPALANQPVPIRNSVISLVHRSRREE